MAKIEIPNISSPYASQNALNVRFKMIEDALNDKVLWRDNPVGEVNTLKNDIDMGNNDLLNVGLVSASSLMVQGQGLEEGLTEVLNRCIEQADEAEASANAAANAASTAASDTVAAASSLLSGYVTSAEAAQTAAEQAKVAASTEAANAEASAIRAETAAEQAELPIASPGDEGKVLTVSPSFEPEWAEVPDKFPPYSVTEAGKILKVSSLGEIEWGVEEDELPSYTPLDAGKTLSVNEVGDAVEWAVPPKGSVNIAPQTIVKSQVGSRPAGWTADDCDAPVASLSYGGNTVTVEAGLQVAYADNGRVQLSEELTSPQTVDLSSAADGTHHVYADIAEDGTFSGFGHTANVPEVGYERNLTYTQGNVTNVTTDTSPLRGDPNILVDGSLAGYVHWGIKTPTVTFDGVSGRLKDFRIFAPRSQAQPPKTWVVEGLRAGIREEVGTGTTSSIDDWTEIKYIPTTITSQELYEQFRLRITDSWGSGCIFSDVLFSVSPREGDLYNPVNITMYDGTNNPIRRVYIGSAFKSGGLITSVNCYALGDRVKLHAIGTILDNPYGGWQVLASQGETLLSTSPTQISGVTINTTPVVVRR